MKTLDLFEPPRPTGFAYRADFISPLQEREMVERFSALPFQPFEFQGFVGNRRTLSFGWQYDFNTKAFRKAGEIPQFLLSIRDRAAEFAGVEAKEFEHALLLEYPPGAAIGWHKDKPQFGKVVGISLVSPCKLRFRRRSGSAWERASLVVEPRSAYLLDGPSRTDWEHSIPAVESLRYSVTFRTLARHRN